MICKLFSAVIIGTLLTVGILADSTLGQQPYQQSQYQAPQQQGYPQQNYNQQYGQPAQNQQGYAQPEARQPAVRPMAPVTQSGTRSAATRPAAPQVPFPPLSQAEQDYVNRVLDAWEKYGNNVKTFEAKFTLRTYGSVFDNGQDPKPQVGTLKYGKPDKGYFEVEGTQPEKWICDGMSLFEYDHTKKEMVQHILPPEERGKSIQNGPLPFLFGSTAATLNRRYWIRALPSNSKTQIWLEAYPKFARDAADFYLARMIVNAKDMTPVGIQLLLPNRKTTKSYAFTDVIVNDRNPLKFFQGDPFNPKLPRGWTKVVQDLTSAQATASDQAPRR